MYSVSNLFTITDAGIAIAGIAIALMIMSSLVRRATVDMEKMKEIKNKLKEHQEVMKEASRSGDMKKMQRAQEEVMKLTMENLKQSLKPMSITIIPFIMIFTWLKSQYANAGTVATLFGFDMNWFWWYFICAVITSILINKILNLI
ncbi:MAG: hypothetical protein DRO94_00820 [Candidatus Altiarchaeales archaeon]|nr:MAG: hypothetical protein DRO95_01845 [Candidatus Altiarchaeales archaeon]RLI95287.1 MAG: hypothetical protein DRO94_00820 [Candidatus Altiarchaeales archaeon]HDO82467.1 DUF106 domain-containing protein [Candidatus Altiarchaeales archaeon]HEX55116.1 DUF106 domain-containing protein [Candidatus Altiarchaeales archaeon]